MKSYKTYITEAQSEWERKHELINKLVKAGVAETSHLWLATMDELHDMAKQAGLIDEAEINTIKPIGPGSSMTDKINQPQGNAQTAQGVKPVSPAANVQIGSNTTQSQQQMTPQDIQNQIKTAMQNPNVKNDFETILAKLVAQAGIK